MTKGLKQRPVRARAMAEAPQAPATDVLPSPAPGPVPRSRKRARAAVVLVVLVAAALVLSLEFSGVFHTPSSTSPGPSAIPFSTARSIANATADAHGSWELALASGYDLASPETVNLSSWTDFGACNLTSFVGPSSGSISLPAFHGNLTNGDLGLWVFAFFRASGPGELVVVETGSNVSNAFETTGAACTAGTQWQNSPNSTVRSAADSPVVIRAALAGGGSAFLRAHPTGVSLWTFILGRVQWYVSLSTCSFYPDAYRWYGEGVEFDSGENASTGALLANHTATVPCGGVPPIAEAVGLGNATLVHELHSGTLSSQGCEEFDYCYSVPVVRTSMNVTPDNLSMGVFLNNNGDNGVVGYAVVTSTGQVVVSAKGTGTGAESTAPWTPGIGTADTLLTPSMRIMVDMGSQDPAGVGYVLSVEGWGAGFSLSPYFSDPLP